MPPQIYINYIGDDTPIMGGVGNFVQGWYTEAWIETWLRDGTLKHGWNNKTWMETWLTVGTLNKEK